MLKHTGYGKHHYDILQPPSGGCVLKQYPLGYDKRYGYPAAFRRLCVETLEHNKSSIYKASRLQAAVC